MSLIDFCEAVNARLPSNVTKAIGKAGVHEHGIFPRVVWVPVSGSFRGPQASHIPRQRATRSLRLDAHLWGASIRDTEALLDAVVLAAHFCARGSITFGTEEWEDQDGGAIMSAGVCVIVSMTVLLPVVEPTPTTATVTAVPTATGSWIKDGSDVPAT